MDDGMVLALKDKEDLSFPVTWMNLEGTVK